MENQTHTLPAYWASYLINGDDSGISVEERRQADDYLTINKLPAPVGCSDEEYFSHRNDATSLGGEAGKSGDVLEFTFLISI